jgi:hypothetical protein
MPSRGVHGGERGGAGRATARERKREREREREMEREREREREREGKREREREGKREREREREEHLRDTAVHIIHAREKDFEHLLDVYGMRRRTEAHTHTHTHTHTLDSSETKRPAPPPQPVPQRARFLRPPAGVWLASRAGPLPGGIERRLPFACVGSERASQHSTRLPGACSHTIGHVCDAAADARSLLLHARPAC